MQTTVNSSPPGRATRSSSRTQAVSRAATLRSSVSPTVWPERVVDDLEAVEIERQHADAVIQAPGVAKLGLELAGEQRAVRQPGQRILQRAAAQLLLGRGAVKRAGDHVRDRLQEPRVLDRERAGRRARRGR